jgi:hypothetical protein
VGGALAILIAFACRLFELILQTDLDRLRPDNNAVKVPLDELAVAHGVLAFALAAFVRLFPQGLDNEDLDVVGRDARDAAGLIAALLQDHV